MTKFEFTEEETIQLLINMGLDGAQRRMDSFHKRGKIDNKHSLNAHILDLKTLFEIVELKLNEKGKPLGGKKRIYILKNKKMKIEKRQKGYFGMQLAKTEDEILKEYVFNELLELKYQNVKNRHSLTGWSKLIKLIEVDKIDKKQTEELFKNFYTIKESERVANTLMDRLKDRNKDTIDLAFKHLEKENRITRVELYFKKENVGTVNIEKEEFEEITEAIRKKAAAHGMEYRRYVGAKKKPANVSDEDRKVIISVDKMLMKTYKVKGIFKMIEVNILDENAREEISEKKMKKAALDKVVILNKHNQKKKAKKKKPITGFVEKEFQLYNMLYFLQEIMNIKGLEDLIDTHSPTTQEIESVQAIIREYAEQRSKEEREMVGFGANRRKAVSK